MTGKLIIVESPSKIKTISKYCPGYTVLSTCGHFRKLPKKIEAISYDSSGNINFNWQCNSKQFKPIIDIIKKNNIQELVLATDRDREGEGIAWHVLEALKQKKLVPPKIYRICFSAITKVDIEEAFKNPMAINLPKVYSYLARVAIDFLIGFTLSPLSWVIQKSLSIGRVQIPALGFIVDNYMERKRFVPKTSFHLQLCFPKVKELLASFRQDLDKKQLDLILKELSNKTTVKAIKCSNKNIKPKPPFITSTLQQAGVNKLGKSVKQTMQISQQLYEGIPINGEPRALITYIRTDSTFLSKSAIESIRYYISNQFESKFLPNKPNIYSNNQKNSQEAHEAIRVINPEATPESISNYLTKEQLAVYRLIWERSISCQMTDSLRTTHSYTLSNGRYDFCASHSFLAFKGNLIFSENNKQPLKIKIGDILDCNGTVLEKTTKPPAYYTEASLVKQFVASNIGRPSTFGDTIDKLLNRCYIIAKGKQLIVTEIGIIIYLLSKSQFDELLNCNFTSYMENELTRIVNSEISWFTFVLQIVDKLENIKKTFAKLNRISVSKILSKQWNEMKLRSCNKCKNPIEIRFKYTAFLHCSQCQINIPLDTEIIKEDGAILKITNKYKQLKHKDTVVYCPVKLDNELILKSKDLLCKLPFNISEKEYSYEVISNNQGFWKKSNNRKQKILLDELKVIASMC